MEKKLKTHTMGNACQLALCITSGSTITSQNKWYSQRSLLTYFGAKFNFKRTNLLAHNNLWLRYYRQVNSLRLKPSEASKWASKLSTIYFAGDGINMMCNFNELS